MGSSKSGIRPRTGGWWRFRQRVLSRWIRSGMPEGRQGWALKTDLFDEASGPYHHLIDISGGFRVVAIDLDLAVARQARAGLAQQGPSARVVVGDVRALPLANASLALVLSLSTLDHFASTGEVASSLREIRRVLRPGGRLLLTLDNPWNPEVFLRARLPAAIVRRLRADTFPIGETLGAREAERLLHRSGFQLLGRRYLVHAPRFPVIRLLDWLERLRVTALLKWIERLLESLEGLWRWPFAPLSGHYTAWWLRKVD